VLPRAGHVQLRVFKDPRVLVEQMHGVQARRKRGIDVALGAVSNHPGRVGSQFVTRDHLPIYSGVLLGNDLNSGEEGREPRAGKLVSLFRVIALGHEDQAMAAAEIGQGLHYAGEELNLLVGDGSGQAANSLAVLFGNGIGAEALIARNQRTREAGEPVSVGQNGFPLHTVQGLPHLFWRVEPVVQIADEGRDGPLEVDVVFPEGVIGIYKKCLAGRELGHRIYRNQHCSSANGKAGTRRAGTEMGSVFMLNSAVNLRRENILMKAVLGFMGLAAVLTVSPLAGAADLTGTWKGTFDYNGNSVPAAMNLKVTGNDLTGNVEVAPNPPSEIHEGKVDGDNLAFWINSDYQGATYKIVFKGKVAEDRIDFSFGTEDGSWGSTMSLKKGVVDAPAAAAPSKPQDTTKPIDVTGNWKGAVDVNGTSMAIVLNLKSSGATLTGTAEGMGAAPIEIHDGKVDGNLVTFWLNADYQGQTYALNYKGTVTPNQIDFVFGTPDGSWGASLTVKK